MKLYRGDCMAVMANMPDGSVDAVVTDPPYEMGFMDHGWDQTGVSFEPETWAEMLRLAKPGAHLLSFGGTRTVHRIMVAIEDAGWVIRDLLAWGYAQGMPKSSAMLKPAWEPIILARKSLDGSAAENRAKHGTGLLNIDDCRLVPEAGAGDRRDGEASAERRYADRGSTNFAAKPGPRGGDPRGRWPANVVLTDPIFDGGIKGVVGGGFTKSGYMEAGRKPSHDWNRLYGKGFGGVNHVSTYADEGTYSRFFLIPKASKKEREPLGADGERMNLHPTVKPRGLMRHLVRLVTPSGGVVLDPFLGSGTTALAAVDEGFDWVGIELDDTYAEMARARLLAEEVAFDDERFEPEPEEGAA